MKHLLAAFVLMGAMFMIACSPSGGSSGNGGATAQRGGDGCKERLSEGKPALIAKSAYRLRQACGLSEDEFLDLIRNN